MRIKTAEVDMSDEVWTHMSSDAKDFIMSLLRKDPEQRPDGAQALAHPWIATVSERTDHKLEPYVLKRMRQFSQQNALKRAALGVLASQISTEDVNTDRIGRLEDQFLMLDSDGTGEVSYEQFIEVLIQSGCHPDEAQKIFESMDAEKTDSIQFTEFLATLVSATVVVNDVRIQQLFEMFDVDGTGKITKDNLMSILGDAQAEDEIDDMLSKFDKDSSGCLDHEEFKAAMLERLNEERQSETPGSGIRSQMARGATKIVDYASRLETFNCPSAMRARRNSIVKRGHFGSEGSLRNIPRLTRSGTDCITTAATSEPRTAANRRKSMLIHTAGDWSPPAEDVKSSSRPSRVGFAEDSADRDSSPVPTAANSAPGVRQVQVMDSDAISRHRSCPVQLRRRPPGADNEDSEDDETRDGISS